MYFLNSVVGVDPCRVGGDLVGLQLSSLIPWRLSVHCPPLLRAVMLMAVLATKRHGALHLLLGHIIAHCVCVPTVHCSQSRSPTATRVPLCPFTPFPCDLSNVPVLGSGRLLYRYTTWSSFREVVDGANNLLPHHSFVPITFSRGRGWG